MITNHRYDAGMPRNDTKGCIVSLQDPFDEGHKYDCGRPESEHLYTEYTSYPQQPLATSDIEYLRVHHDEKDWTDGGLRGPEFSDTVGGQGEGPGITFIDSPDLKLNEAVAGAGKAVIRKADAAQYARPAIPEDQRGQIRVRLLNATPDPLGSVAALCEQYKGNVIRSLAEVTDEQRRACLDDMASTVLNGPLEAVQFHWQIEGVTRSITHQMVRSRASFFAQESLRFAIPEGNWADEIPLPPSLAGVDQVVDRNPFNTDWERTPQQQRDKIYALDAWKDAMINSQNAYERLIELGVPAEEARGVLPHDMPTRIHWVMDLRTLLAEAGKRTCTQAQFPWRMIFAGMASALRERGSIRGGQGYFRRNEVGTVDGPISDGWQFKEIARRLRPVCYQTGSCGFMAKFDRSCKIRERVDANARIGRSPEYWGKDWIGDFQEAGSGDYENLHIKAIHDYEWAADPSAARS